MSPKQAVRYFAERARHSGRRKRQAMRLDHLELAKWYEGRQEAFLHAARMVSGNTLDARTRNGMKARRAHMAPQNSLVLA